MEDYNSEEEEIPLSPNEIVRARTIWQKAKLQREEKEKKIPVRITGCWICGKRVVDGVLCSEKCNLTYYMYVKKENICLSESIGKENYSYVDYSILHTYPPTIDI